MSSAGCTTQTQRTGTFEFGPRAGRNIVDVARVEAVERAPIEFLEEAKVALYLSERVIGSLQSCKSISHTPSIAIRYGWGVVFKVAAHRRKRDVGRGMIGSENTKEACGTSGTYHCGTLLAFFEQQFRHTCTEP